MSNRGAIPTFDQTKEPKHPLRPKVDDRGNPGIANWSRQTHTVLTCCIFLSVGLFSTGCERSASRPASTYSTDKILQILATTLPDSATNIHTADQAVFTLSCFLSVDLPTADLPGVLQNSEILPALETFQSHADNAEFLQSVGQHLPWWNVSASNDTTYAHAEGQRQRQDHEYTWTLDAALQPLPNEQVRMSVIYVEENAPD